MLGVMNSVYTDVIMTDINTRIHLSAYIELHACISFYQ